MGESNLGGQKSVQYLTCSIYERRLYLRFSPGQKYSPIGVSTKPPPIFIFIPWEKFHTQGRNLRYVKNVLEIKKMYFTQKLIKHEISRNVNFMYVPKK